MTEPRVDIVTVLYKSAAFAATQIQSVAELSYPKDRMIFHVVDNGHGDGSLDEMKKQIDMYRDRLPRVVFHEPGTNTGFAGGNNIAMREAIREGADFVFLLNADASFEPNAVIEAVAIASEDPTIGSVQSLIVLQQNPEEVNSTGNAIHYLGMGYCKGYHEKRSNVPDSVREIAYASGAAVLIPTRVLKDVGLLDETLWLYHEDLDLGWRMLLAGYKNVLAPKSVVRHHYEFSRSTSKWYWMERNRLAVVLKNYHVLTLIILAPQLVIADLALMIFALKGGYWKEKIRAWFWFFSPKSWSFILRGRREIARIRKVSDRRVFSHFTPVIAYQEFEDPFIKAVVNPSWKLLFTMVKAIVIW